MRFLQAIHGLYNRYASCSGEALDVLLSVLSHGNGTAAVVLQYELYPRRKSWIHH